MRPLLLAASASLFLAGAASAAPRVVSLDQCADQYVLALSPREAIAGLSYRADGGDSFMAARAKGLPKRRATLEALLAAQPQVALRTWGGDAQLVRRLQAHGVKVVSLDDAEDFAIVRADVRTAAAALGNREGGEALVRRMDIELAEAGARPTGRRAAYITPGGATAGPGTLVDAMLSAAGLTNAETRPGFRVLSLERLAFAPPRALVLGFFDIFSLGRSWWQPARNAVLRREVRAGAVARLPGAVLSCPGWFAAGASLQLSRAIGS